jgi:hypothetical protein
MKKITFLVLGQLLASVLFVNAQTSVSTGVQPLITGDAGFLQFNNLVVQSVTLGTTLGNGEIIAQNGITIMQPPLPMGVTTGGNTASGANAPTSISGQTCYKFDSQNSATSMPVRCPVGPPTPAPTGTTTSGGGSAGGSTGQYPLPPQYAPYRIEVGAGTVLLLRDRTHATLADFSAGDEINVFGYYNTDGTIQAYLVRDLSKPTQKQFIQLNNADLVSIGGTSAQPTLVVVEQPNFPCYNFDATTGNRQSSIACPMGITAPASNAVTQNLAVPQSMSMIWQASRKYVVNLGPQTIILDRNRARLTVADLKIGDKLNIYGSTGDNGQTIDADIVRDLSQPVTATAYSGQVTQVNTDGSFLIQTTDGRTLTVQNPIKVGVYVQIKGLLDSLSNVLSQVTSIIIGNGTTVVSTP